MTTRKQEKETKGKDEDGRKNEKRRQKGKK